MSDQTFLDNLKAFGLTGQEALIYETLLKRGAMTGYEVSKETGISRSNAYGSLNSLKDKGAAYVSEGDSTKYVPEDVKVFLDNCLRELNKKAAYLVKNAPKPVDTSEGFITVSGTANIKNKIEDMLGKCELRFYIQAEASLLEEYREILEKLVKGKKKAVIIAEGFKLGGATVYNAPGEKGQIRLIVDSSYVLTGTLSDNDEDKCLYSGQSDFVMVMKEALRNKIVLIQHNLKEEIE